MLEAHVGQLPQHVVEPDDRLRRGGPPPVGRRRPRARGRPRRPAGARRRRSTRVVSPHASARRSSLGRPASRRRRPRRARRRARERRAARPPDRRRRRQTAGSARLPMITGCTNSTATWRACSATPAPRTTSWRRPRTGGPRERGAGDRPRSLAQSRAIALPARSSHPAPGRRPSESDRRVSYTRWAGPAGIDRAATGVANGASERRATIDVARQSSKRSSTPSHDALFSQDAIGRLVVWNRSAERIFGHHAEDVVGEPVLDLFPCHVRPTSRSSIDAVLGGDRRRPRRDGDRAQGRDAGADRAVAAPGQRSDGHAASASSASPATSPSSASPRPRWPRPRPGSAKPRRSPTPGAGCGTSASGAVQWSEEMHRIHGIDPARFDGTLDAHLACRPPRRRRPRSAAPSPTPSTAAARSTSSTGSSAPTGASDRLYARAEPTFGSLGAVVGLRGFAQDVTERDSTGSR